MTYDALNRVTSVEDPFGLTLNYTYDADGNRTEVQDSLGGVTTYVYDADNELTSEQFGGTGQTPLRIDMTYDADGEILTETRYSDLAGTQVVVTSTYTYNADGEVTDLLDRDSHGNTVAEFSYTYDSANRVTSEANLGMTTSYTYDADNELTSETSPLDKINYTYDADGNRIGGNNVIGPDNQLLSDGTWNYTYDADGNLIQKVGVASGPEHGVTWTYTYDNRNEMISAVEVQGSTTLADVTYSYDVYGDRIQESASGSNISTQVTRFAYDGQNVWADLDGNNNLVIRRLFLVSVDSVTARITASGTVAWYLVDRLGSVGVITDSTGDLIDRIVYDGYGNIIAETNPSASDRYLFTGREFDRVTGLQFNRARYYDPSTGRWTTEDPTGFAGGDTNFYRYVEDNPTDLTDPNGTTLSGPDSLAKKMETDFRVNVVAPLIKKLGDPQFDEREKASDRLRQLLQSFEPGSAENRALLSALERASKNGDELEAAKRAECILDEYPDYLREFDKRRKARISAINTAVDKLEPTPEMIREVAGGISPEEFERNPAEVERKQLLLKKYAKHKGVEDFLKTDPAIQQLRKDNGLLGHVLDSIFGNRTPSK